MIKLNRWIFVLIGVIILVFSGLVYSWSVLKNPIAKDFDWSQTQLSLTFTITMICFCLGGLFAGFFRAKLNAKVCIWVSGILLLIGFIIVSKTQSLGMLYVGFGIIGGFASGFSYNITMSTMIKWFPEKQGLISGILLMGFGLGGFIIGKFYQKFTPDQTGSWRNSFLVLGIIIVVIFVICGFFFIKPHPSHNENGKIVLKAKKKIEGSMDVSASKMLKRPSFWFYFLWAVFLSTAGLALISQASGIIVEASPNIGLGTIATSVGLISIFNGIGRVIYGALFDKAGFRVTMITVMISFTMMVIVLFAALEFKSAVLVIIGFIVGGFAFGGITPTNSALISSFYGQTNYSINFSMINLCLIFSSFGSTIAGALFDASNSYMSTLIMIMVSIILGFICFLGIRRP